MQPIPPENLQLIVTGGARGIGAATTRLLASQGAYVMITDVLDDEGRSVAQEFGSHVTYRHLDVTQPDDWCAAVTEAEQSFGRLNGLFNNAGILAFSSVADCTPEQFQRVIDVNLVGAFLGIKFAAPASRRAGGGTIVNTSSTAGLQGYGGLAAHVASKWGVRGLTKAAALDLADHIRVSSLHPGPIRTPMTENLGDEVACQQPIPRLGEAEEVARMARFLFLRCDLFHGRRVCHRRWRSHRTNAADSIHLGAASQYGSGPSELDGGR